VLLGELWSWTVEMVRVGDAHLSYRAFRMPWVRHRPALFAIGMALCWVVVWWRYRASGADVPPDSDRRGNPVAALREE
jgi:hypothetical protein